MTSSSRARAISESDGPYSVLRRSLRLISPCPRKEQRPSVEHAGVGEKGSDKTPAVPEFPDTAAFQGARAGVPQPDDLGQCRAGFKPTHRTVRTVSPTRGCCGSCGSGPA